jgi:hypothetical protein
MLADGEPAWLLAWREREPQPQAALASPPRTPSPPKDYAPRDNVQFAKVPGADLQGFIEPDRWDYDGCVRLEPVMDTDYPPRVVRKIGWQRCLKCGRPFFSEDVIGQRLCSASSGMVGCRGDEDRFS